MSETSGAAISPQARARFFELARSSRTITVGCHVNPDGDALGSALALAEGLEQTGAEVEVVCWHQAPATLKFLPGVNKVRRRASREADLAIIVDLESFNRLGGASADFEEAQMLVVIDHHIPKERPGDLRLVDPTSASTAGIILDLLDGSPITITPTMAENLLTGVVTDTGCFRHSNTTPQVLRQAARLCELGGSLSRVTEEVYQRRDPAAARLLGWALSNYNISPDGRLAWLTLTNDILKEVGASDEHTEGIVNEMLAQSTVEAAALLREVEPGRVKGSLRSRGMLDVAACAQQFGGGGHRNAAGLVLSHSWAEAERQVVEAMSRCLASS